MPILASLGAGSIGLYRRVVAAGAAVRDYVIYDDINATTKKLRGGTINIVTGASSEDFAFNIYSSISGGGGWGTSRTDTCRLNGYIGYQSQGGFYIFNESGSLVGSKVSPTFYFESTVGVDMCVCGNFIIGLQPISATSSKVWKFDTTTEVFTELRTISSYTNNIVFGVAQLKADTIGLSYWNGSPYEYIETINVNTGTYTNVWTGSYQINVSYPSACRTYRLDDTYYFRMRRQGITVVNLEAVDFATNSVAASADIVPAIGATVKTPRDMRVSRGENTDYIMVPSSIFSSEKFVNILSRDFSAAPFRVYHGMIGNDSGYYWQQGSGGYYGDQTGTSYIYNSIVITGDGTVLDSLLFRQIDQINQEGNAAALYITYPSL